VPRPRGGRCTAKVYFTPDEQTPRLRKGRYLYVPDPQEKKLRLEVLRLLHPHEAQQVQLGRYVQVSAINDPFGASMAAPAIPLLPFDRPEGISDLDVVAVVDLVRSDPHPAPMKREGDHFILRTEFNPKLPIHRIERGSDAKAFIRHMQTDAKDLVIVYTGWQVGMLAGSGQILYCKRTEQGYELLDEIGGWVS
jgi:hypothetical protein